MMIRRKLKLYSLLNYCPTQIAESENVKIYDRECVCWWCLAEEREREEEEEPCHYRAWCREVVGGGGEDLWCGEQCRRECGAWT